jgi:hypothetical protein
MNFLAWKEFIFMGRAFPEEHFKITVGGAVLPDNFDDVKTICARLRARKPGRQGAGRG